MQPGAALCTWKICSSLLDVRSTTGSVGCRYQRQLRVRWRPNVGLMSSFSSCQSRDIHSTRGLNVEHSNLNYHEKDLFAILEHRALPTARADGFALYPPSYTAELIVRMQKSPEKVLYLCYDAVVWILQRDQSDGRQWAQWILTTAHLCMHIQYRTLYARNQKIVLWPAVGEALRVAVLEKALEQWISIQHGACYRSFVK